MTYATNLLALNAIAIGAGGTGGHANNLSALNEIATLNGAAGGHLFNLSALNAIDAALGGTGDHLTNLEAINSICVLVGGSGGHSDNLSGWQEIESIGFAEQETINHINRVEGDGGVIYDKTGLNNLIKQLKNNSIYNNLAFYHDVNFGVKVRTDSGHDYVTKIYDISTNARDHYNATTAEQAEIVTVDDHKELYFIGSATKRYTHDAFSFVNNDNYITLAIEVTQITTTPTNNQSFNAYYDNQSSGDFTRLFFTENATDGVRGQIQVGTAASSALATWTKMLEISVASKLAAVVDYGNKRGYYYRDGLQVILQATTPYYYKNMANIIFPTTSRERGINKFYPIAASWNMRSLGAWNGLLSNTKIADWAVLGSNLNYGWAAPKVILSTDDGINTNYTWLHPELMARNWKCSHFINGSTQGTGSRTSWAQCLTMHNDGMEIGCHGYTHTSYTTLTEEQLIAILTDNDAAFVANGLPAPETGAYPNGAVNDTVTAIVAKYRKAYRAYGVWDHVTKKTPLVLAGAGGTITEGTKTYPLIYCFNISQIGSDSAQYDMAVAAINFAKRFNIAVHLMLHNVNDAAHEAKLTDLFDHIESLGLSTISQKKFYEDFLPH